MLLYLLDQLLHNLFILSERIRKTNNRRESKSLMLRRFSLFAGMNNNNPSITTASETGNKQKTNTEPSTLYLAFPILFFFLGLFSITLEKNLLSFLNQYINEFLFFSGLPFF